MRDAVDIEASMGTAVNGYGGTVSVPVAWATFGGSTCLLFLLCYVCQRKLQERDSSGSRTPAQQVYVISSIPRMNHAEGTRCQQAPPNYENALLQKRIQIEAPPSYEAAVATKTSLLASSLTL